MTFSHTRCIFLNVTSFSRHSVTTDCCQSGNPRRYWQGATNNNVHAIFQSLKIVWLSSYSVHCPWFTEWNCITLSMVYQTLDLHYEWNCIILSIHLNLTYLFYLFVQVRSPTEITRTIRESFNHSLFMFLLTTDCDIQLLLLQSTVQHCCSTLLLPWTTNYFLKTLLPSNNVGVNNKRNDSNYLLYKVVDICRFSLTRVAILLRP